MPGSYDVLPSSQPPYAVPKQSDADPKLFHYYPRDRRRNVEAPVVVENPAVVKMLAAAGETSGAELVDVAKVRPPKLANYTFQIAPNQPKHDGYFPITNYQ